MLKHSKRILALIGATAAVALIWAGLTLAKPPKPPEPPPPEPSSGTIFYDEGDASHVDWISRINWDGTGATPLYSGVCNTLTGWDVSHSETPTVHRFLIHDESRSDFVHGLYVVDLSAAGSTPRLIHGDPSFYGQTPALSQDDTKVAFEGLGEGWGYVYVADLEKDEFGVPTGLRDVHAVAGSRFGPNHITWSPCGQYIAYEDAADYRSDFEIYVVSLTPVNGEYPVENITNNPTTYDLWPEWSPDLGGGASRIAFYRGGNIYTVLLDGSDLRLAVSEGRQPSWSPDGSQIAFLAYRKAKYHYAIMRTAADGTTSAASVTGFGNYGAAIHWRP
jgi:Tol biopolymer transport system component